MTEFYISLFFKFISMLCTVILKLTTSDWISLISAIATFITAIIALLTIREVKKQREHSYYPDLTIANFEFYVYRYDKDEDYPDEQDDTIQLYYSKPRLEEKQPKLGYNNLTLCLNNIGFGVSKDITYQWYFDFNEVRNALFSSEDSYEFKIEEDDLSVVYPRLKFDSIYSIYEENSGGYINFILPYSIENRELEIYIPQYFMDFYWIYKSKEVLPESKSNEIEYPPLKLAVSYTNIHGKKMQKIFLIFIRYNFIANPDIEKSEIGCFRFEIIEA